MDRTGLLHSIYDSVISIAQGRTWLDTDGLEPNGRVSYKRGLDKAMTSFQEAHANAADDLQIVILAEQTFLNQELQFCDSTEKHAISSLEKASKSFDDALRSLEVVADKVLYTAAEKTHPTDSNYRISSMPKDAFHAACISHRTRINNVLRTPGINLVERQLFTQRLANMTSAQNVYLDKQKAALEQ